MVPLVAAGLISGGSSILGGLLDAHSAKSAARSQQNFQERMSNTSYQRAVTDLKAAGLNPMLAYSQGGASTPQGAKAETGYASKAASNVGSALAIQAQIANVKKDTELKEAQRLKEIATTPGQGQTPAQLTAQTGLTEGQGAVQRELLATQQNTTAKVAQETLTSKAQEKAALMQAKKALADINYLEQKSRTEKATADWQERYKKAQNDLMRAQTIGVMATPIGVGIGAFKALGSAKAASEAARTAKIIGAQDQYTKALQMTDNMLRKYPNNASWQKVRQQILYMQKHGIPLDKGKR